MLRTAWKLEATVLEQFRIPLLIARAGVQSSFSISKWKPFAGVWKNVLDWLDDRMTIPLPRLSCSNDAKTPATPLRDVQLKHRSRNRFHSIQPQRQLSTRNKMLGRGIYPSGNVDHA